MQKYVGVCFISALCRSSQSNSKVTEAEISWSCHTADVWLKVFITALWLT